MNEREFALMDQMREAGARLEDEIVNLRDTVATSWRASASRLRRGDGTPAEIAARLDKIAEAIEPMPQG